MLIMMDYNSTLHLKQSRNPLGNTLDCLHGISPCAKGIEPFTAAAIGAGGGFALSSIFGGKKKKKAPPPPSLSKQGKEFQEDLFSQIEKGLAGRGLTPEITSAAKSDILREIQKQKGLSLANLPSQLNRVIRKEDVDVRQFARENVGRIAARATEATERAFEFIPFEEQQEAINLASGALSSERRVAANITSQFNQFGLAADNAPTFESELAGGFGSAAGLFAGSRLAGQRGANVQPAGTFNQQLPGGPVGFARNFIGDDVFFTN